MVMKIATHIPTKSRPENLEKLFHNCPILNDENTFVGIEPNEKELYRNWRNEYGKRCSIEWIDNPHGFSTVPLQQLKTAAFQKNDNWDGYLLCDDNCVVKPEALENLKLAFEAKFPCFMGGLHSTAKFYHKTEIENSDTIRIQGKNLRISSHKCQIFWIVPAFLYNEFQFSERGGYMNDAEFILWAMIEKNFFNWYSCVDSPFQKKRHQFPKGKKHYEAEKVYKICRGIQNLCILYPEYVEISWISTRISYKNIMKKIERKTKNNG